MRFKRKGIMILVVVVFMSAMLMGCNNNQPNSNVPTGNGTNANGVQSETQNNSDNALVVAVGITSKNEEILRDAEDYHVMDFLLPYAEFHNFGADHHFFTIEDDWGIMIWADAPLYNFQVNILNHETYGENHENDVIYVEYILYELAVLPAGVPIILDRFVTVGGVLPREGISFEDRDGNRKYFGIADDRRGEPGDPPYYLLEFENGGGWLTNTTSNTPFPIALSDGEQWAAVIIVDFRKEQ